MPGIFRGAGAVLAALFGLSLFSWYGPRSWPTLSGGGPPVLRRIFLGAEQLLLYVLPRRYPVLVRRGISPAGLRIALPLRGVTVPRGRFRPIGSDWVELEVGLASRLAPYPAYRLATFVPWA